MAKRGAEPDVVWRETKGRHADAGEVTAHAIQDDKTLCGELAKVAPWNDSGRGARCQSCMRALEGAPLGWEEICAATGITYRQLDQWTRKGLLHAAGDQNPGTGKVRRWPPSEVKVALVMHALVNMPDGGLTPAAASRAARNNGRIDTGVVVVVNRDDIQLGRPAAGPPSAAVTAPEDPVQAATAAVQAASAVLHKKGGGS